MRGLRDKVAIVAGAAPGNIGGATALRLAQEGMNVAADLSVNNIGRDTDVTSVPLDVWQHTAAAKSVSVRSGSGRAISKSKACFGQNQSFVFARGFAADEAEWVRCLVRRNQTIPRAALIMPS